MSAASHTLLSMLGLIEIILMSTGNVPVTIAVLRSWTQMAHDQKHSSCNQDLVWFYGRLGPLCKTMIMLGLPSC